MKREIVCLPCSRLIESRLGDGSQYSGEHVKYVRGWTKRECMCDNCGTRIIRFQSCVAISIWSDFANIKYFPWEYNYLGGQIRED